MIQAAVPIGGRAVVVYSRVFPFKRYNSPSAHREFLHGLKIVLPDDCCPTLITDAGFRGPWFRAVEALGWNWVGRIRNRIKYLNEQTGRWSFGTIRLANALRNQRDRFGQSAMHVWLTIHGFSCAGRANARTASAASRS